MSIIFGFTRSGPKSPFHCIFYYLCECALSHPWCLATICYYVESFAIYSHQITPLESFRMNLLPQLVSLLSVRSFCCWIKMTPTFCCCCCCSFRLPELKSFLERAPLSLPHGPIIDSKEQWQGEEKETEKEVIWYIDIKLVAGFSLFRSVVTHAHAFSPIRCCCCMCVKVVRWYSRHSKW